MVKRRWQHLKVSTSPISGHGLFTTRGIRKGAFLGYMAGRTVKKDGKHVLWLDQPCGRYRLIEVRGPFKYMNHSARPNVELGEGLKRAPIYAKRPIRAGEELTWFYAGDGAFVLSDPKPNEIVED